MFFNSIVQKINDNIGSDAILEYNDTALQPFIVLNSHSIALVCELLKTDEALGFDFLVSISGMDYGLEKNELGVVYHLRSISKNEDISLKVILPRTTEPLPQVPSITHLYRTAEWHEREAYDFFGIEFTNHPDLRRILLPDDWEGYPLRKDYTPAETYKGIKIKHDDAS